jgi:hypothetical protein
MYYIIKLLNIIILYYFLIHYQNKNLAILGQSDVQPRCQSPIKKLTCAGVTHSQFSMLFFCYVFTRDNIVMQHNLIIVLLDIM